MPASVLYVDDDRNLCQIVSKAFAGEGYSVRTCHDGAEALSILEEHTPDLVLLDVMLPRRDGFEVLGEMRRGREALRALPVVILTGCSPTPAYAERANSLDAFDLLAKPVPLEKLLDVVARAVAVSKPPIEAARSGQTPASRRSASGTFERVSFPALLHHLHGLRASGTLHLAHGKKCKWVQLRDGYPVAVRSNMIRETLGRLLQCKGRLRGELVEESRRVAKKRAKPVGEILVAMEVLSEDQVVEALREQADEKFFEIFSWPKGSFRFERDGSLERANALVGGRSPADLILEGVRRRFPIERIDAYLERHAERYVARVESPFYRFQDLHVDPADSAMLRGIDGTQQLGDFRGEEDRLRRTLYALLASGLLELRATRSAAAERDPAAERAPRTEASRAPGSGANPREAELEQLVDRLRARDPHTLLGVAPDASPGEVALAYERLSALAHPDRFSDGSRALRSLADELFVRAREAFQVLCDPRQRQIRQLESQREKREEKERLLSERAFEAEVEFRKGEDAVAARSYEAALVHFGKSLELYPDEGDYHAHYGYTLHLCHPGDASMVAEAMEHVKRGLKLASHREKPYLFLGRLYKAVGRADAAEKMFVRAIQIESECLEAIRELRLIQMRREKSKGLIGRLLKR